MRIIAGVARPTDVFAIVAAKGGPRAVADLKGKTVAPFNTHAGYGVGSGFEEINRLCKGCRMTPGLSLQGGRERDGILFVMEGRKAEESGARSGNGCPD